ncbi:MAG: FxLYD domain-containing protein [Bacillota bacterium]
MQRLRLVVMLMVILILLAACGSTVESNVVKVVSSEAVTDEFGMVYITGEVQNTGRSAVGYVQVNISILDEGGAMIDNTIANTLNLQAGQIWKFRAPVINPTGMKSYTTQIETN